MAHFCKNCGVELEESFKHCPLCGLAQGKNPTDGQSADREEKNTVLFC